MFHIYAVCRIEEYLSYNDGHWHALSDEYIMKYFALERDAQKHLRFVSSEYKSNCIKDEESTESKIVIRFENDERVVYYVRELLVE